MSLYYTDSTEMRLLLASVISIVALQIRKKVLTALRNSDKISNIFRGALNKGISRLDDFINKQHVVCSYTACHHSRKSNPTPTTPTECSGKTHARKKKGMRTSDSEQRVASWSVEVQLPSEARLIADCDCT